MEKYSKKQTTKNKIKQDTIICAAYKKHTSKKRNKYVKSEKMKRHKLCNLYRKIKVEWLN